MSERYLTPEQPVRSLAQFGSPLPDPVGAVLNIGRDESRPYASLNLRPKELLSFLP